ncbi:MAG: CapA family protein [Verrucomicrobiales bacterium]|nr:CapA family protein [Verrucomicrobiales bacterium]
MKTNHLFFATLAGCLLLAILIPWYLWNIDSIRGELAFRVVETETGKSSLLFVGDTHPGESYFLDSESKGRENILETRGYSYSFRKLVPLLESSGSVIANLETPITADKGGLVGKPYNHWSSPRETPLLLRNAGIRIAALGNNHTMDQGAAGLVDTVDFLDRAGITWFGAGRDIREAYSPVIIRDAGHPENVTAVISVFQYIKSYAREYEFYARNRKAGVASARKQHVETAVKMIRDRYPDALIVAFPHWGANYQWRQEPQKILAREFVDSGVDLVIGHGAHNLQEIEQYRNRLILYSIGNFVFNSRGRYREMDSHPYSLMVKLETIKEGASGTRRLTIYPIFSDNRTTQYQPRFTTIREFDECLELVQQKSSELGATPDMNLGQDSFGYFFQIDLALDGSPR